jgi:phosphinothricin acetyltransferase
VQITAMTVAHAGAVLAIYQAGIDEGNATFETRVPDWDTFTAARLPDHRYVAIDETGVLGWVAASPVSARPVYAGVVEHSVYVHPRARGRGTGRRLLETLIASTEAAGIWTIQSGIFPENTASVALHRAVGFRVVGTREHVGRHHGRWRDVLFIERRSAIIWLAGPRQDLCRRAGALACGNADWAPSTDHPGPTPARRSPPGWRPTASPRSRARMRDAASWPAPSSR